MHLIQPRRIFISQKNVIFNVHRRTDITELKVLIAPQCIAHSQSPKDHCNEIKKKKNLSRLEKFQFQLKMSCTIITPSKYINQPKIREKGHTYTTTKTK